MDLNHAAFEALFTGYKASFQSGFNSLGAEAEQYRALVTDVPSTTSREVYPWLQSLPRMREWLGDRVIHGIGAAQFAIINRKFELTVAVGRDAIEDDTYGLYNPMMQEMGRSSAEHPNLLVTEVLERNPICYDGQNFFDTDHPVLAADGVTEVSASNEMGGAGVPWYVLDLSRAIRPLILQRRRPYAFRALTNLQTDRVFMTEEFLYGVDARLNAGPGLWQLAVRSRQVFNAENYALARARLQGLTGDHGRPLGLRHTHTLLPLSLEAAARKVLMSALGPAGETNEWAGTSQLLFNPWLKQTA